VEERREFLLRLTDDTPYLVAQRPETGEMWKWKPIGSKLVGPGDFFLTNVGVALCTSTGLTGAHFCVNPIEPFRDDSKRAAELQQIVPPPPKTIDGVSADKIECELYLIESGRIVCADLIIRPGEAWGALRFDHVYDIEDCYSTREAAEKRRRRRNHE